MTDNTRPTGMVVDVATDELITLNGAAAPANTHAQRVKIGFGLDGDFNDVGDGSQLPVVASTFHKKLRDAFQTFPGTNWQTVGALGTGDIVQVDGNAAGASYLVISKDPFTTGSRTVIESAATFGMALEFAAGIHMSQRTLGQLFSVEIVSTEAQSAAPADVAISSIQQATTTLTVTTATPHGYVPGQRIGIYGVTQDSRLNYSALVIATTPSTTQFTATAGPSGTIPSLTVGPFTSGFVYVRSALNFSPNGSAMLFENATATNASFYVKAEGGDATPIGGTIAGNHSVTTSSTASTQAIASALTYAFRPTSEYRLSLMSDKVQWQDVVIDSLTQTSARATMTQIAPNPDLLYKIRFRAENFKGLTVPVAKIVSVAKVGSTTATVTTDVAHGLTTGDYVNTYGVRDQTNFANLTTAAVVASVVNSTTFTIVWGSAVIATSYGGYVARANGGQTMQGAIAQSAQSATIAGGILTLVGSAAWSGLSVGDYVNNFGCRDNSTGADMGLDGAYRVRDVSTTSLVLEPIGGLSIPTTLALTNCGGGIIKRTDMRISFVRLFEYERVRTETLSRPSGDIASAAPVVVQSGTMTIASGTVTTVTAANINVPAVVADVASAAITTTTTTSAVTPTYGSEYEVNIPITAVSGTNPTLDVVVQESDDSGTNWYDVWHFPRVTTATFLRSPKLPFKGNRVRYVQTLGGTSPSFTRAINRLQGSHTGARFSRRIFDRAVSLTTLNATTTTAAGNPLNIQDCSNVQLVINVGAITTTAPALQLEGSDDNGVSWYPIGTSLTAVASSTVQVTMQNVNAELVRARVSTAGVGVTAGYVSIKAW